VHRLTQQGEGVVLADDRQQVPGAVRHDDAMDFGDILHGL